MQADIYKAVMMNLPLTPTRMPMLAFLLSLGLLIGAWVFQYGFGYAPCQMCYWQRHAHKIVIGVAVLGLIAVYVGKPDIRLINALLVLALLGSAAMALWHVGVEYKWWEGPKTCASGPIDLSTLGTGQSLLDSLNDPVKPPACSEAVWHFLGLSMAGWNMIISTAGALGVGLFGLRKPAGS